MALSSGIVNQPITKKAGLKTLWILGGTVSSYGPYVSPATYLDPSLGATGLTSIGGTGTWYNFALPKNTSSYSEAPMRSGENSSLYYEGTLTAEFYGPNAANDIILQNLLSARFLKIIVMYNDNTYRAIGLDNGAEVKTAPSGSGTKPGDNLNYKVTFTTEENNSAYWLQSDIATVCAAFTVQPQTAY
jgi:hypothetical protein